MKRTLLRLSIPFREPFTTSTGVVVARELVLHGRALDSSTRTQE